MFNFVCKLGFYKLGDFIFYFFIESCVISGNFGLMERVFDRMKCERCVFRERDFILVFKVYGKVYLFEKVLFLFERMAADEF